jgi:hypothetical protein
VWTTSNYSLSDLLSHLSTSALGTLGTGSGQHLERAGGAIQQALFNNPATIYSLVPIQSLIASNDENGQRRLGLSGSSVLTRNDAPPPGGRRKTDQSNQTEMEKARKMCNVIIFTFSIYSII